jgi:hypothetical protein
LAIATVPVFPFLTGFLDSLQGLPSLVSGSGIPAKEKTEQMATG